MIGAFASRRPRPRSLRSGAFFVGVAVVALGTPAGGSAQVPDTVPSQDTTRIAPEPPDTMARPPVQDTLAQDTAVADTQLPPPTLPPIDRATPAGWSTGVWEWDREALLRLPDLTLLQLLQRVPGLNPVRAGIAGHPEAAGVFGATVGAIRYVFDGFELDPLITPTVDPSRIALLALEEVRVERRVTGATVYLETLTPTDPRPQTVVEAATGDYDINLFRGTFLAPSVLGGSLGLGFDRLATGVLGGSNFLTAWVKWTVVRDSSGLQLELRQTDLDRAGVGPPLVAGTRRDWVVRARTRLGPVVAEGYAGGSIAEDEVGPIVLREGTPQGGLRLSSVIDAPVPLRASAALRLRSHPRLPGQEVELEAWAAPAPWLGLGAEVVQGWWDGPGATGRWSARARLAPVPGLAAFAELHDGGALLGGGADELWIPGTAAGAPLAVDRSGMRAGVEAGWGGLRGGIAVVRAETSPAAGFGLPFDSAAAAFPGGEARGVEAMLRIPTPLDPIRLEGWYVGMDRPEEPWPYLPRHQWRAAIVYHHSPLPSGNLELYSRVEHVYRGGMAAPAYQGDVPQPVLLEVPSFRSTNLELVIRVLSVRAFLRWENLRHRLGQQSLPLDTYRLPGQHIAYGVKWEFFN